MKTNRIMAGILLATGFGLIIFIGSIKPNQAIAIPEKTNFLLPDREGRSAQEKTRYQFVGAEKCASVCHNNDTMGFQFNSWNSSPHRDAFNILASKKAEKYAIKAHLTANPQESQACLKCHITGGELDSSYFTATYKKEEGVTCEECHKHIYDGKTYLPTEADCLKCHNDSLHKVHKFDFRKGCTEIAHKRPAQVLSN
jgi:hypothetical protein